MNATAYLRRIADIKPAGITCASCAAEATSALPVQETVCNFCESYVGQSSAAAQPVDPGIQASLQGMQAAASQGEWEKGAQSADALAATKDPALLFGASAFYRAFSDSVYCGVDYTIGGFMYPNADRRSDEPQRNRYNAVSLASKSKEFLFKAIKIIGSAQQQDDNMLFMSFMANVKLKRYVIAQKLLSDIDARQQTGIIKTYANMVFNVERKGRYAERYIDDSLSYGISNAFYYLSMHLAMKKELGAAIGMLDAFAKKANMPAATYFNYRLKDILAASYA